MADYVIINKENTSKQKDIRKVEKNISSVNSEAQIIHADSIVKASDSSKIKGKRVLVVEDGPTLTHGGTKYGAGYVAAKKYGAKQIVDPKNSAVGSIKKILEKYDNKKEVLPAMGYDEMQRKDLEKTIDKADCDVVISATPHNLGKSITVSKPIISVNYKIQEKNKSFEDILKEFIREKIGIK